MRGFPPWGNGAELSQSVPAPGPDGAHLQGSLGGFPEAREVIQYSAFWKKKIAGFLKHEDCFEEPPSFPSDRKEDAYFASGKNLSFKPTCKNLTFTLLFWSEM